ncbi:MAG: hypothetical protein JWL77_7046 [Chthonomonadaceae bacterium]|nr:hypothetical protein [Chthonomonadaceae bacterium]
MLRRLHATIAIWWPVPFVRPVNLTDMTVSSLGAPPGVSVALYPVSGRPASSAGGFPTSTDGRAAGGAIERADCAEHTVQSGGRGAAP